MKKADCIFELPITPEDVLCLERLETLPGNGFEPNLQSDGFTASSSFRDGGAYEDIGRSAIALVDARADRIRRS